ncbi:hypothetical protein KSF_029420 [Reticulibacter mediterranei]|uniref:ARB-07466-like C-terminal domain-containing protein n=1 Tax=Reticulibacter mediterranei TaxID=2778369 RepID=A0A8J3ICI8_9CHLR|nr:glucosaminidase domain-containing protein [Reticulibacter mediterranei]GHO92894.1 hypothetical protein KSF_029420 [Reticulibacter mediterranei]
MKKAANALGLQQLAMILVASFFILYCFISGITVLIQSSIESADGVPGQLPDINSFGPKIDTTPNYQPQSTCDPTAKPGVQAFHDMILKIFPNTGDYGITRDCGSEDGISEHKEGRAWDWKVNANNPQDVATVNTLFKWLFATDKYGHKNAMITRLGIMYIIWNKQIWGAYRASDGWRPYSGVSEHTDHVHFSFYWIGANKQTTFWNPQQACEQGAPCPMPNMGGGSSSVLGSPTVTAAFIDKVLAANHSPAQGTGAAFYTYGVQYGIDPVFALAFFKHESSFGTAGVARYTLSISNTVCTSSTPANERYYSGSHCFHKYANWTASVQAWFSMIRTTYVGQWNKSTIEQIIPTYAPASDGNNVAEYISEVQKSVATWRSGKVS